MKKFLLIIFSLVAVLAIGFVVTGMMLDKNYELSRSIIIDGSPSDVHKYVGDLAMWDEWTPWKDHDDSIVVTLGNKTTGVGAMQTWTSKDGKGELTFTKSDRKTGIEYDMAFFAGEERMPSTGAITYEEVGKKTRVTWSMKGEMNVPIIGGWYAMSMETMVGPYFDEGLEKLRKKVEGQ